MLNLRENDVTGLAALAELAALESLDVSTNHGNTDVIDLYGLAQICRGRVRRIPREAAGSRPDADLLGRHIGGDTRALLLTQPENPFGWVYGADQIACAAELARRRGLALIIDTAFAELAPDGPVSLPDPADDLPLLLIGDTGKLVSLHGHRLGALASSRHFAARVRATASALFLRLDTPRLGALAQIFGDPRLGEHRCALVDRVAQNHRAFVETAGPRVRCSRPEATSMAVITVPGLDLGDVAFTEALLAEEDVALVPLSLFFAGGPPQAFAGACSARLTLARPEALVREAATRLQRFLARRA